MRYDVKKYINIQKHTPLSFIFNGCVERKKPWDSLEHISKVRTKIIKKKCHFILVVLMLSSQMEHINPRWFCYNQSIIDCH